LAVLLAGSCSSVSVSLPEFDLPGTYAGTGDAGSGRLVLGPDHAFSFWVHFKDFGVDWNMQGQWSVTPLDEGGGPPDAPLVDLIVDLEKSRVVEVNGKSQQFPEGTFFRVFAGADAIVFCGPCIRFDLSRVR
jgi:hypothetical protein